MHGLDGGIKEISVWNYLFSCTQKKNENKVECVYKVVLDEAFMWNFCALNIREFRLMHLTEGVEWIEIEVVAVKWLVGNK